MNLNEDLSEETEINMNRLLHDINSSMSALSQALDLVSDNFYQDRDLALRVLQLSRTKMDFLLMNWEKVKSTLK